jgi:hypothetical protein
MIEKLSNTPPRGNHPLAKKRKGEVASWEAIDPKTSFKQPHLFNLRVHVVQLYEFFAL